MNKPTPIEVHQWLDAEWNQIEFVRMAIRVADAYLAQAQELEEAREDLDFRRKLYEGLDKNYNEKYEEIVRLKAENKALRTANIELNKKYEELLYL